MSDWICYGQTVVPAGSSLDNPLPNHAGAEGEVSALPYVVPPGMRLRLTAMGIEGNPDNTLVGMFPWIGPPPVSNAKALMSVASGGGDAEEEGFVFDLPAGTILNLHLMNNTTSAYTLGWYMKGELVPA